MPKEQHINTFQKGMVRDPNVIFQPDGTYRYAKNCQVVSQDGNNWTITDALGNTRIFQINIPYATYTVPAGVPTVTYATTPMVIGLISFTDKLVVFSTNDETESGGYGEIGLIYYDTYGEGVQPKAQSPTNTYSGYKPLYHHVSLKFTKQRQIEGFAFDESESHQRVYWTDHLNEPRVFDVGDSIYTNYLAETPATPLVVGQQYMVLEGVVEHPVGSLTYYGPGLTNGNVFTASATSFDDEFGGNIPTTAKVIQYYPYQLLAFNPSRSLGTIKFKELVAGSLYCGSKMYFYRLLDPLNGVYTSWSYGSAPIPVGTDNNPSASPANAFFNYVGAGSTTTLVSSGRAVIIDIANIDTNFSRIQVACAEFDQSLEVPRLVSIIADEVITGTDMVIEHTGSVNLGELTIDDLTLFPASILKCKTMTTNKGYNLIGNITEREEFEFDITGITLSEINGRFAVHTNEKGASAGVCANVLSYDDLSLIVGFNPTVIYYGHQYIVESDAGGAVTYDGNSYSAGQVFTGTSTESGITIPVGSLVRACCYRNRYTTTGGTDRPEVIAFYSGEEFWTYKNPAMSHHKLGYWKGEKYRFGVMFYDLKGNPYYVKWIGDFDFNAVDTTSLVEVAYGGGSGPAYDMSFLQYSALKVSGLTIPAADIDKISGFSIVRAERDKRIITEGLLTQLGGSGTVARPAAAIERQTNSFGNNVTDYYAYICPDALVGFPMTNYGVGSNLEGGFFMQPPVYNVGPPVANSKSVNVLNQMESRFLIPQPTDNVTRKKQIVSAITVDEGFAANNFGTGNYAVWNLLDGATANNTYIDNSCNGGGNVNFVPAPAKSYQAVGGRKTYFEVGGTGAITDYGGAFNYYDLNSTDNNKLIIDVTVDNTNQYGGQSDTALANTLYISTGHFQPITSAVKADTLDINGDYTFNNIHVYGGDCYTALIDYGYGLYAQSLVSGGNESYSLQLKFPCQCNANYDLRRGRTTANNKMYYGVATQGVWYNGLGVAQLESFSYNEAYSSQGTPFKYPALPFNFAYDNDYKYRVRFAGLKNPGETVNSFRQFFTADFKDLDGQGGEINNIRTKDGRVIVWQNAITSTVPVLERQVLSGGSGAPTSLGTGGVVDRYDPMTSYFGNQHQHGLTQTEFGFVWFDMRRKAFMVMDVSAGIVEVSQTEGMKSFFDEIIIDNVGVTVWTEILNSPTFAETSDRPLVGVGITGVYDPKFKMTYLTFKYINHTAGDYYVKLNKDFTIGYYHPSKIFVGFYDWTPAIAHNHGQIVISANNPKNKLVYYGDGMTSTNYVIGDVVSYLNAEWMCIADVTVAGYRLDATKEPGTSGASYWTKINQTNELWVHNQPTTLGQTIAPDYLYNKIFGQVVNNEIQFVINPKVQNPFTVMNMEQVGNNSFPTSVEIEAGSQTASDTSIRTTSNYYRYIWDRICSNMPLSSTGRIVNNYLLVKLIKQNWTSPSPTVLTGTTKVLKMVYSFFVQKR